MRLIFYIFCYVLLTLQAVHAQKGHEITVQLDGFQHDTLILGYYLGTNQYVRDTAIRHKNKFVFADDEALEPGMYMIIAPPKNDAIQLVIDEEQQFSLSANYGDKISNISFKGSKENELYYSYVDLVQEVKPRAEALRVALDSLEAASEQYQAFASEIQEIDARVLEKTSSIIDNHPTSFTALILNMNRQIEIPEFEGTDQEVKLKRFHYYKRQYLANMNLDDARAFRTPYLYEKVNYYTDKLTMRSPDSIIVSVDHIIEPLMQYEDAFQYYLVHMLNKYAKSKIVGQDAVYVHIADKYYASGKADWTDAEQLSKILKNAKALKPTLIGKTAPNLTLYDREGTEVQLHDIEANRIILYFWNPDCGHCKKSTPKLIKFQRENMDRGIRVVTVCGKSGKDYPKCWEYIDEREDMDILYNLGDEFYKSRFKTVYYVKTTPKLFVLDKDKKILSKGIGVEQLPDLIKYLDEQDAQQ